MNSVNSDLTFTVETVYDFKNKRLATLDFEAEVIENQVVYSYFQKPMKSPLVIGEASAMSDHQKFSILSNEVIRRMSNISDSDKISQKERVDIINKFTRELKSSGYTRRRAREIVACGLLGLERKGIKRKREGQSFHRKGKNTLHKRNLQKLNGKSSWFKNKPVDKDEEKQKKKESRERLDKEKMKKVAGDKEKKWGDPKAVMFIPYTPNSELAKELRKVEDMMEAMSGMRIKIVEKTGVQLKRILVKTNPWAGTDCLREDCLPCQTREETSEGKGKSCSKRNVLYETWCESCKIVDEERAKADGKDPEKIPLYKYIGESSRSSYLRGKNHLDDARLLSTGSHMLKHYLDKHQEDRPEDMIFRMKVLSFKRSAYERQVHESVLIQQNRKHMLLNSRSEFNRCSIPRLTVKLGDKKMTELAASMREEQKKEGDLERVIRNLKKNSKKVRI